MKVLLLGATVTLAVFAQAPVPAASPAYRAVVKDAQSHVKRVDVLQFRALRSAHPNLVLIDVREADEWSKGHATGALHITKGMIEHDIEAKVPQMGATIVLYCHSGSRSALAAENLQRMGYTNVYSLDGGLTAYQAAGLPVEN